jgi:hypothetical protein
MAHASSLENSSIQRDFLTWETIKIPNLGDSYGTMEKYFD